jgi:hypothetical protein
MSDPVEVAAATLVVEQAAAEAVRTLRSGGFRSILIKGPPQQRWLSAAGPPRSSADVDLLVDPAQLEQAGAALAPLGYAYQPEVTPGVGNHSALWDAPDRVAVELHARLANSGLATTWKVLQAETEDAAIGGTVIEVPNEAARCLIVTLHAAQHGITAEMTLTDLERAITVADRASWNHAVELAHGVDAETAFNVGLGLVPSGERLRHELGLRPLPPTERIALDVAEPVDGMPAFYWLGQQESRQAQVRFIVRKVVPPRDFMRFKYPYAEKGPGHLALAYADRAAWMARSAPGAYRAWRRARRASEPS